MPLVNAESYVNLDFRHSPDYRSIKLNGCNYTFTSMQAQVIQLLHEQHLNGTPEIGKDYILEELGSSAKRIRDIFQCCDNWKDIIIQGERKGTYRLNI